jgi:hypothetical protein
MGMVAAFRLIELALKLLALTITPQVFELFLTLQLFHFFFPARFGLLFDNFLELVCGSPCAARHEDDGGQNECVDRLSHTYIKPNWRADRNNTARSICGAFSRLADLLQVA